MSLLALSYLATQYQLALHRWRFIGVLVAAALAQPLLLLAIGSELTPLAIGLMALQAMVAAALLALSARRGSAARVAESEQERRRWWRRRRVRGVPLGRGAEGPPPRDPQ